MQLEVTVKREGKVLVSKTYPIVNEGDAERAIGDAMAAARQVSSGAAWDYEINVKQL